MKNLYQLSPKAYKQGFEILRLLPKEDQEKIPSEIWQFIEEHMDLNEDFSFNEISLRSLLPDTNLLLAIVYKSYLASNSEKTIIKAKEHMVKRRKEAEALNKYNPQNLFKK